MGNGCIYFHVFYLLCYLPNLKLKIYKIMSLFKCIKLRLSCQQNIDCVEKKVLRRIFGTKTGSYLMRSFIIYSFYLILLGWWHQEGWWGGQDIGCMVEWDIHILVGKLQENISLGKPRNRWQGNTEMELKKNKVWEYRLDLTGWGYGAWAGFYECDPLGSLKA